MLLSLLLLERFMVPVWSTDKQNSRTLQHYLKG